MNPGPLIRASVARPFIRVFEAEGGDPGSMLTEVGLMPDLLERPEEQVIELRLYHFLVRAATHLDLPAYGLLAGDGSTVRDLGSFGCRLEQSVTLFELIETFTRTVSTVASHARFWIVADEDDVWFCRAGLDLLEVGEHHAELFVLGLMKQIVRLAAGPDWMPKRIRLKRKDPTREPFAEGYEGAEILFAQPCTAIAFPPSLLPRPLVRAAGSSLVEQLRKILRSHSGDLPDVHRAASSVGCSTRTLQRTLAREGLSYRRLTDQARYATAIPLLRDAEFSIVDVAHQAGYSDQAHFTRAFRRWTGMSPARFRRMQGIP